MAELAARDGWLGRARRPAERPLELEAAVAQTAADRARSHGDETGLVLEGLQRQLAKAGPRWWPGSWGRRTNLKARIAAQQQALDHLDQQLHQAEQRISELPSAQQPALDTGQGQRRQGLDVAPLEQAPAGSRAVGDVAPRPGPRDVAPTPSDWGGGRTTATGAQASVGLSPGRRAAPAGADDDLAIAIVGGSITGPVACLLLRQAGFANVQVYEATPRAVPQAGGVIWLDHTSLGVLDTIGVPQEEIIPFPSQRVISVKVADRRELGRVETLWHGRNTTWTLTHGALAERLPANVLHTGARLVGLEPGADGRAVLQFQDGDRATADLVVFADGRRSTGRRLLDPDRPLRYAGYVAHRGQLDDCPPALRDLWRYEPTGTQFNVFPIQQPDGDTGADWTFYLNTSSEQFRAHFGADPTVRTYVLPQQVSVDARTYVDAKAVELLTPDAADLVCRTTRRMAVPVVDIAPPTRMVYQVGSTRAVLLGDALAPVRPHLGRGANNGIDQSAGLVTALTQHRDDGIDLDVALTAWQARCLPVVTELLELGPELGREIGLGV
jgi:2,6-dihydroxypyridine 3-monooxygenase